MLGNESDHLTLVRCVSGFKIQDDTTTWDTVDNGDKITL